MDKGASCTHERYIDNFLCNMDLNNEFKSSFNLGLAPCQCSVKNNNKQNIFRAVKPLGDSLKFCLGFRHQKRLSRSLHKCLCKKIILYSCIHAPLFYSGSNSDFQFMLIFKKFFINTFCLNPPFFLTVNKIAICYFILWAPNHCILHLPISCINEILQWHSGVCSVSDRIE